MKEAKIEAATNWAAFFILKLPAFIRKEQVEVKVRNSMLANEVECVCSVWLAHLKL